MKRALLLVAFTVVVPACGIDTAGVSRESEYYEQVTVLQDQVDSLTTELDQSKTRIAELESDEHARFIDAYLQAQALSPDEALATWDAFLQDFPESPLAEAARELRDRVRARALELDVVEADEYRALLDKLKTADGATRTLLIEDFLVRFPKTTRKADLEKRAKTAGDLDALRNRYLGTGEPGAAPAPPTAPPGSAATQPPSGRMQVEVPHVPANP